MIDIRERVLGFLREAGVTDVKTLGDGQGLITSGILNSLMLLNLILWIENETGRPIDLSKIDLPADLDNVGKIVDYLRSNGQSGQ